MERTTEVASHSRSDSFVVRKSVVGTERVPMLRTSSARMLTPQVDRSQFAMAVQQNQHVVVPVWPLVLDTAATLQLPVLIEKSAQSQLKPMLGCMAVAETEHSALASGIETLVRIVQSEPE